MTYPNQPIRFILPFAAGGPGDLLARLIGQKLKASWGQPLVTDVRPGSGLQMAAQAAPDGYTFVMVAGSYFINPSIYRRLPFDSVKDFAPVSLLASIFNVLVVHPAVPARSLEELIAFAKSNPGQVKYASSGYGSAPHLAGELFKIMTGVDIGHVAYKGHVAGAHALSEGREVHLMFDAMSTALPHVQAGELRALAVTTAKRAPALPDIPTMAECGLREFEVSPAIGVLAPARTPPDIIARLSSKLSEIMQMTDIRPQVQNAGMEPIGSTPEEFASYMRTAFARWDRLVKQAGLRVQESPG